MQHEAYTIKNLYFWRITLSLALASFFVFAGMYAVQPLFPLFVKEFGVSVSASGLALSMTIIGLIAGLIVEQLADEEPETETSVEDGEVAAQSLRNHQFKVLRQNDLSR